MTDRRPIPALADYSASELAEATADWPAIGRYLGLIDRPAYDEADRLRVRRHRHWLEAALATRFARASAEAVCFAWSEAADRLISDAWSLAKARVGEPAAEGVAIFALGKLGARELNLSSDVDLFYAREDGADPADRTIREFQRMLSENTGFGFALRVDVSIRPGGPSSPICPSYAQIENHYGYHGEMWERLALIRLRSLEGPHELRESIESFAIRYAFRKHLDYTLLDDLRALRARIRAESPRRKPNEFHLKLGTGGIRELELFTQSLLAMHGGRKPELRTGSTTEALQQLNGLGVLPAVDADLLLAAYWLYRERENRLQGYDDQQTYWLNVSEARAFDAPSAAVAALVDSLLGEDPATETAKELRAAPAETLGRLGFSASSIEESWPRLLEATALSRRSEKDETERLRFLSSFVERLAEIGLDKDLGLALLVDFTKAIRAKASFFALLNREPRIAEDLARLFSTSPYLSGLLCARPELIDSFLWRATGEPPEDLEEFLDDLGERRLIAEIVAANRFLSKLELSPLLGNLTETADSVCGLLIDRVLRERGAASGAFSIVCLGKWGGREIGLKSDLDFIFASQDPRVQETQKAAKRFMSWISEPRRGGSIYSIDVRLRPSGAAGALITSWDGLREYLERDAMAWERQAYLRARPLGEAPIDLAAIAAARGLSIEDRKELLAIRAKLFVEAPGEIDLKLGDAGLARIEFAAQIALLDVRRASLDPSTRGMIQCLMEDGGAWASVGDELIEAYDRLRALEQLHQLTANQSGAKLRPKSDGFSRLAAVMGRSAPELEADVRTTMKRAAELLSEVDPLLD